LEKSTIIQTAQRLNRRRKMKTYTTLKEVFLTGCRFAVRTADGWTAHRKYAAGRKKVGCRYPFPGGTAADQPEGSFQAYDVDGLEPKHS